MEANELQQDVNELVQRRLQELKELKEMGINPFPYEFDHTHHSKNIIDNFEELDQKNVKVAGRIMAIRRMGKASFAHIMDKEGKIQVYLRKDDIGEDIYKAFKKFDIGDIIGVEGYVFKTKKGETSVHANKLVLLTKSIRPIPIAKEVVDEDGNKKVYDQFADKELRYRQRYLDLIVNPEVKNTFLLRSAVIKKIREYLDNNGLIEVETPILQPLYGGASARPFVTHHNALDMTLYMRIADELYLKRLIVGGFEGVYEIGKDFRNEGIDKTHNPEFTMLEFYVAYKDYEWMMNFFENMVEGICLSVFGKTELEIEGTKVDFKAPWNRISMLDEIKNSTGIDVTKTSKEELAKELDKRGVKLTGGESVGKLIDELFEATVQDKLVQPTFVVDYPVELSPLAKKHREKEGLVERFEGFVLGREICNAFSELNDPIDQRERFEDQAKALAEGDDEAHQIDDDFVRALEYGMPPTAGLGMGVDRLIMLLANEPSIRDVLLFPHMRPQK